MWRPPGTPAARWALFIAALRCATCWRTSGVLPTDSRFAVYAGKFCFDFKKGPDAEAGLFEFRLHGRVLSGSQELSPALDGPPQTEGNLYLFVFDDEADHWKRAHEHWSSMDCEEMMKYQSVAVPLLLNGEFNRSTWVHEKLRPRFWYFTFAACGVTVMEPVRYEIHATNIQQGLQSEFGIDERGSLQLQILAAGMFLAVCISLRRVAKRSTGAEALRSRPLLRMLILSSLCSAAGALSLTLHYLVFMFDGYGISWVKILGELWVSSSKAILTLLQLLTAKGWALFYAPEELVQRRLMICLLGGIVIISMACELHAEYSHDWSTTIYLYESYPGLAILLLNVVLFTEAWRSMRETYRHESSEEVRVFYVIISASSLLYFLTLPVMCILAAALNPWARAKYVDRAEVTARFASTALLAFCLRPSRLDAMVNARLEDGLETVGELREDTEEPSYCEAVEEDEGRTERSDGAEPLRRAGPAE